MKIPNFINKQFIMSKVIGILGTTNSCVSILEGDEPKVIQNPEVLEVVI